MPTENRIPSAVSLWPGPRPDADRVLICFGYSGGGTAPFRPWARELGPDTELALYCYPGRDIRSDEDPVEDWPALLADAAESVAPLAAERPYLLFGHSLGAWVAFEVAHELERRGLPPAAHLFVSAMGSPTDYREQLRRPPTSDDTEEELRDWLLAAGQIPEEVAEEPELVQMAVDLLRADLTAAAGYRHLPGSAVRAPITAFYGAEDPDAGPVTVDGWRRLTAPGGFRSHALPGGHFYTPETWAALPTLLTNLV